MGLILLSFPIHAMKSTTRSLRCLYPDILLGHTHCTLILFYSIGAGGVVQAQRACVFIQIVGGIIFDEMRYL